MKDMAAIKPIREWKHVFLDTSIIIDYLNNPAKEFKDQDYKQRILASHKILNFLLNPELLEQDKSGKVKLYVSVITLSEMIKDKSPDVSKEIVRIFSAADIEFLDYTKEMALLLNKKLEDVLPDGAKHQFIAFLEKELKKLNYGNARQWVQDDLKIVATAKSIKKLDMVLTSDGRTFKPIADKFELPCVVSIDESKMQHDLFGEIV